VVNRNSLIDRAFAPFGEIYDGPGASDIDFSDYTQNALSGPTGLYDTPNREVSPTQGRWLSPDPAGLDAVDPTNPQSWNRYAYVTNNPLALTDPSGLFSVGRGDDPFDPSNDCGWTGFNDFGQDFCSIGDDEMLSPFSLPNSRLGCLDDETPGCAYGASSE
jgi:RHS repeat-associated protein